MLKSAMKTSCILIFFAYIFINIQLFAQDNLIQPPVFPEDLPAENNESGNSDAKKSKNINLDMQALYGIQYNQMFSAFSISQERDTLVYLLTSKFDRSGDFGYKDDLYVNSGFYNNTVGLTVNWNWTATKLIIEGEADNESRGMFNNTVYSHEDEGNNKISAKTIYKLSPSTEIFFLAGGAWYKHSLVPIISSDLEKSRVLQGNVKVGGEYVWSASNRMRMNADLLYYDYSRYGEVAPNDRNIKSEIIDDFNITRNVGISIGVGYVNNKDDKNNKFPVPITASISFKEYKYFTAIVTYKYDIIPFQPEEFYLQQKYVYPTYDLPPATVQIGEIKTESRFNSVLNLKASFKFERNNNYYNYYTPTTPIDNNVLSAEPINADIYNPSAEANFFLYSKIWEISLTYDYFYFKADKNITYEPKQEASSIIRYNGKNWKFEWVNKFRDSVYIDPGADDKLTAAFIGSLGIQRKILEGSYLYGKVDNLYNNNYSLRIGYPEPGISFLLGLRILI